MQVSVAGLRRAAKNIAHNYTDPQKKVREATSNDPWGPSSTLMSEIADLTYNIEAFSQIMEMLWKRLNDHGKNWRHVYKSLVLLEYLIKTGSERVGSQCKENIFAIQTLKDFQHLEDNKDQGLNVREKAKQLVLLLSSDERLRNERTRALKARERFAQTVSGFGGSMDDSNHSSPPGNASSPVFNSSGGGFGSGNAVRSRSNPELEQARPQTVGEEELQLQLALAMSKEEADQEEKRRRSDELRLQMALSQSEQEFKGPSHHEQYGQNQESSNNNGLRAAAEGSSKSALVDLLDVDLGMMEGGAVGGAMGGHDPWTSPTNNTIQLQQHNTNITTWTNNSTSPWNINTHTDPWSPPVVSVVKSVDPWGLNTSSSPALLDSSSPLDFDEFDLISKRLQHTTTPETLKSKQGGGGSSVSGVVSGKRTPAEFLGENSSLVNLDNLIKKPEACPALPILSSSSSSSSSVPNPFSTIPNSSGGLSTSPAAPPPPLVNPFQNILQKPSINELRLQQNSMDIAGQGQPQQPQNNPWSPVKNNNTNNENPFY